LGYVDSDIDTLKAVITLTPGQELFFVNTWAACDHPVFAGDYMQYSVIDEHKNFVSILRDHGVCVLDVEDLLTSSLREIPMDDLRNWIKKYFREKARFILRNISCLDGAALIGRKKEFFFTKDQDGNLDPTINPLRGMFYTRDFSCMTSKGLIISNFVHYDRSIETPLIRLMFKYAPELRDYKVVFDAEEVGFFFQGGDAIVFNEDTLFLGVNNVSEIECAQKMAQQLDINVIAVSLPQSNVRENGVGSWLEINQQLVHLDTIFNLVDKKKVLAIPYILERQYNEDNPLYHIFRGLQRQLSKNLDQYKYKEKAWFTQTLANNVVTLKRVGWVTYIERGTGRMEELGVKLLDYMRDLGYEVIYVCGEPEWGEGEIEYTFNVLRELRFQGANILALSPGHVIAFNDNVRTVKALKKAGVRVIPFFGNTLLRWCGGPHCMSMPLERASSE
jgi:arginine deiminase